ncbi:MAG: ribosome-associated translation inhibitor RaiA [Candidatus Hydrogenedentes bacterium]|nr:ribosome-associated translation inhibitor RaiA [Candidatus Hydrogenedentota bacterium]
MNVKVTGRHMDLTDALRNYIHSGLRKVETHFDRLMDADVVLDVQKHRHIAEVNLHANGVRIHGKEASSDMYASVDAVFAKLEKQIRKHKERINRHQPRTAREERDYAHAIISVNPDNGQELEAEAPYRPREIHREKLPMKPMNVEEAVLQLELVDDPFLVFSNADTSRVNVLYSRDDGTYGLIEPQF